MTSNHQLTTRGIPSSSNLSSLPDCCKYVQSNMQVNRLLKSLWLNRYPVPFKCIIKPRTPAAEALIRNEEGYNGWEHIAELNIIHECSSFSLSMNIVVLLTWSIYRWITVQSFAHQTCLPEADQTEVEDSRSFRVYVGRTCFWGTGLGVTGKKTTWQRQIASSRDPGPGPHWYKWNS